MHILAIDQGTTSTKAVICGSDGEITFAESLRHRQILPQPGFVEHNADELLANVRTLVEEGAHRGATGMALANQGETVVAWNRRTGKPLHHAIVWQDQRTAATVGALDRAGHSTMIQDLSGLPLDPYFSATKLRWMLDHVDGAAELARQGALGLCTSDSFFIERLTGRYVTDVTTASRTSLMNLDTGRWDERLCDIFGVPMELLPEIAQEGEPIGAVKTASGPVPLLAGAVDQIAALYGHGCRSPGDGKVTVGTGAFALVLTGQKRPKTAPGIVPTAAWHTGEGRSYAADGGVYTAAAIVEWLMRVGLVGDLAELDRLTGSSAAEHSLFFVPALAGLACPHWDRSAAGLFIGMDNATSREDLVKAALEGVAFRIVEVIDALGMAECRPIPLDGGLTRSRYFMQFLADIARRPLIGRGETEVTALGIASLARAVAERADPTTLVTPVKSEFVVDVRLTAESALEWCARFAEARQRSSGWRR